MRLTFNRFADPKSFRTLSDFARYADNQHKQFSALENTSSNAHEWWGAELARNWAAAQSAAQQTGATTDLVQQTLSTQPVFPFSSTLTTLLLRMTEQGRAASAKEIMPFLKGQRDGNNGGQLRIQMINAHAEFAATVNLDRYIKRGGLLSFEQAMRTHEDRLEQMLKADADDMEDRLARFDEVLENARTRFEGLTNYGKKLIREGSETWHSTHDAFVEQLATETAVKLWRGRARSHNIRYRSFRNWSVGFGIVGLFFTIIWIFAGFRFARWVFETDPTAQVASYTAGSLALFTLFVWGLRVLIRSMISEDHLSTDASARSALAHTYLSLTKEKAATPEDRAIILASLFAPVSDGLVKDDGMPVLSPAAIAAQMVTNPRS